MNEIQVVRLHRVEGDSKLKAFCDVAIGDFIVKGLKVVDGKKGLFIAMPSEQGKDGKWYETVFPSTSEARNDLAAAVLNAYNA